MKVAVVKETFPGERRVGLVPVSVPLLIKSGLEVLVQAGAGEAAGFADQLYVDKGAKIAATRDEVFAADIVVQVRSLGVNPQAGRILAQTTTRHMRRDHVDRRAHFYARVDSH